MKKSQDIELALLEYRNSPLDGVNLSPAQMLMSRRTRSIFPIAQRLLNPQCHLDVQERLKQRQNLQQGYYDRKGTRNLPPFQPGEAARYRDEANNCWEPVIIDQKSGDRQYVVQTESGRKLKRNRKHLLKSRETPFVVQPECIEEEHVAESASPAVTPTSRDESKSQESPPSGAESVQEPMLPVATRTRSGRVVKPVVKLDM